MESKKSYCFVDKIKINIFIQKKLLYKNGEIEMTDKELIKIFRNQNKSSRAYWKFNQLTPEQKARIFDLINNVNVC